MTPADDIPLSTASDRASMYLAFHVNKKNDHEAYFTEVQRLLRTYDCRPHRGKQHTRSAEDLAPAYPRWAEFQALRDRLDAHRVFANTYLNRVLGVALPQDPRVRVEPMCLVRLTYPASAAST